MNPENQTLPTGQAPGAPRNRMSRKAQALWGLALFLIGLVTMAVALAGAIGGALAGGCCGGHGGGGSSGASFWTGAGFVASGFGLALLLAALLRWRTRPVSIVYFGAIGLFMGIGVVSDWSRRYDAARAEARDAAAFAPWGVLHEKQLAAITKAIETDDPAALEAAGTACLAFIKTVPPEFAGRIDDYTCGMGTPDYSRRLEYAFKANAWRILDRSLDLAQKQAGKSGSWHGASIDPAGGACPVGLAGRDDDAPWLLDAEDQSKTAALREVGNVAAPKGPVPTDLLKVLVRHRGPPLRAGEDALQRLFAYALTQRRMDIVETISAQVEGRFEWCSGGVSTRDLVDAIRPSRRGQVWKDGETTLFRAIASWPPEHWHEVAGAYLRQIVYGDSPSQAEALATCRSAAARIAALRPGADRTSLIDICKAS